MTKFLKTLQSEIYCKFYIPVVTLYGGVPICILNEAGQFCQRRGFPVFLSCRVYRNCCLPRIERKAIELRKVRGQLAQQLKFSTVETKIIAL